MICPAPDSFFPKQFPRRQITLLTGVLVWWQLDQDFFLTTLYKNLHLLTIYSLHFQCTLMLFFLSYSLHLKEPPFLWTFCRIFKRKPPVIPRKNSITFNTPERDRQWKKHCECNKWDSRLVNSTLSARHHAAPAEPQQECSKLVPQAWGNDAEAGCSAPQTCCRTFN